MNNGITDKELIPIHCSKCGIQCTVTRGHYRKNPNKDFYCKSCAQSIRTTAAKISWNRRTDIDKHERIAKLIALASNESQEQKQLRLAKTIETKKKLQLTKLNDVQRELFGDKWIELDVATRNKTTFNIKCKDCGIQFPITYGHYSKTDINHHWRCKSCRYQHQSQLMKNLNLPQTYLQSISPEQRMVIRSKAMKNSNGNNSFHVRFQRMFKESMISNLYYLEPEIITTVEAGSKIWDYGIRSLGNNNLVMVVDLDGAFFHGDNCDYNGLHSRQEYDERRYQLVPIGIKLHIINELMIKKSFEEMIKNLIINYDQFIDYQFQLCRSMPIPIPTYVDSELTRSWNQLARLDLNSTKLTVSSSNREGDRIINHFHHSIYQAKCKGSKLSPYDAWHDDRLLRKVIKNRIIYVNIINPTKILQGFNIAKVAQKVSVFSAGRAKLLIHKYLNDYNEVFDPFSGFSSRMLGAVSLGKKYIGQDISETHVKESNAIIDYFKLQELATVTIGDCITSTGTYQCLFTCPPYQDKEQWYGVPVDSRSCDNWVDICLANFKCSKYLFVVDDTVKYKDKVIDVITNRSHFGSNRELILLI